MTSNKGWICVTGGGGYLGQHIVRLLLENGHNVRATVRDLDRTKSLRQALTARLDAGAGRLSFAEADLTKDDGWDDALRGCVGLIHSASPFPDKPQKNADALISVAVQGTQRVLKYAIEAGVSRAIVTSSIVAIIASDPADGSDNHTELDWSDPNHCRADAYTRSKLASEQIAWATVKDADINLVTLNPGLIFGPPFSGRGATSVGIIDKVLSGKNVALPDVSMPCVDVRDAALAHVHALTSDGAIGERILLNASSTSFLEIANILRAAYPLNKITRRTAPDSMVRAAARFDPFLANVLPYLGGVVKVRSTKAQDLLGMTYRDIGEAILETAAALSKPMPALEFA